MNHGLGVAVAILCGVVNNVGVLLQKKVVNDVPVEARGAGFLKRLVKDPWWLVGLFLQIGVGTATFMIAVDLIGPALVPGLMASGLVVLAVGSVRLMKEKLNGPEYLGIGLMVGGILLLGLSELDVAAETVRSALASASILIRIGVFTAAMLGGFGVFHLVSLRSGARRGIVMGFANGFLFSLSNFWISPLIAVAAAVLGGKGNGTEIAVLAVASVILVGANLAAFSHIQLAFKHGQASNIIPVQQLSVQITPVLVYFLVFNLTPPRAGSGVMIVGGAVLIIAAGFLLGRRQSEVEKLPAS